jgi:hypothetical protein
MAGIAGAYFIFLFLNPAFLDVLGVSHYGVWFADTYAILAANDAQAAGLDPYAANALDHFGRPHAYSKWWLHLGKLGLTRADNFWVGGGLGLAFFIVVTARLRPQTWRELLWYLAVWCSPPMVLALERGNNDLVVFLILAAVVSCVLSPHRVIRFVPVALVALATGLKFYPAVAALVLLAGHDRRESLMRAALSLIVLAGIAWILRGDVQIFGRLARQAQGLLSFGAMIGPELLGWPSWISRLVCALVVPGAVMLWLRSETFSEWTVKPEDQKAWLSFLLGAVLLSGCFFVGNSFAYRLIFVLWLTPLLWRLRQDDAVPFKVRRLARITTALLVAVLWITPVLYGILKYLRPRLPAADVKRWADALVLAEQPLMWAFVLCLLGFLAHFLRERTRWLARN